VPVSESWPLQIKLQLSSSFQVLAGAGDNYVIFKENEHRFLNSNKIN